MRLNPLAGCRQSWCSGHTRGTRAWNTCREPCTATQTHAPLCFLWRQRAHFTGYTAIPKRLRGRPATLHGRPTPPHYRLQSTSKSWLEHVARQHIGSKAWPSTSLASSRWLHLLFAGALPQLLSLLYVLSFTAVTAVIGSTCSLPVRHCRHWPRPLHPPHSSADSTHSTLPLTSPLEGIFVVSGALLVYCFSASPVMR